MARRLIRNVKLDGLRFRLVDAKDQVVGRIAAQLSWLLQGKDKPSYAPNRDDGDVCVVINAQHVHLTGRKWEDKLYRWHTGYPGGLKERTAQQISDKDPVSVLRRAVNGMLPKNKLRRSRMRKLRLFPDERHPFQNMDLVPWEMPQRKLRDKGLGWVVPDGATPMNPEAYWQRIRTSKLKDKVIHRKKEWGLENE